MIQQSYYAANTNVLQTDRNPRAEFFTQSSSGFQEHEYTSRLLELLISELKRKKGKNVRTEVPPNEQIMTLVNFWRESLTSARILHKLKVKQQQNMALSRLNNSSSMNTKLSDKEVYLLSFLEGTDKQPLLSLAMDSTTRNYGELATMSEDRLIQELSKYLGLGARPS